MLNKPQDPFIDALSDAPLSAEQRKALEAMRNALADARAKASDLEKRLQSIELDEAENAILTRVEFNREVARMLAHDERYGGKSSIVYLDIENMDDIAAKHGKAVANAALRAISDALMKNVRNSDIIGRLAPDEFGILLVRCENANAWKKAKDLVGILTEAMLEVQGMKIDSVIGYGAYTFGQDEDVASGLKRAAEMLKRGGN